MKMDWLTHNGINTRTQTRRRNASREGKRKNGSSKVTTVTSYGAPRKTAVTVAISYGAPSFEVPTLLLLVLALAASLATSQCPWPREIAELNGSCLCAYNVQNELSIQCTAVNFTLLMTVLHQGSVADVPLDLLYVNNTRVSVLNPRTFDGLLIENIQFSSCGIFNISEGAFKGLENTLVNLNLQDNRLTGVPTPALTRLRQLKLLDLSGNKITSIPDEAFKGLRLSTLKLADNELSLSGQSFKGLEGSLKNLNLKGTKLRNVPPALRNLPVLAFLDIAQNQIRSLEGGALRNLHSLTALNIERNLLQTLQVKDFAGVNDTLSSLSLLNNLITDFPTEALNTLTELRVNMDSRCLEATRPSISTRTGDRSKNFNV